MRKRIILLTAVCLGIAFTTVAQNKSQEKVKRKGKTHRLDSIATKYGLNETQKSDFKTAVMQKRKAQKALKAKKESTSDKKVLKAERKQIAQSFDSSVKVIFTSDQYTRFKADVETRRNDQLKQRMEKRSTRMADSMQTKYGLSTEQHGKVKAAAKVFGNQRMEIRKKYANSESKEAAKKEMKAARETFDQAMKSVLTEEQYNRWKVDRKAKKKARKKK